FDVVSDVTGWSAGSAAVEVMEASIFGEQREIGGRALEVVVVHFYEQHIRGSSHEAHHDFRDDAALAQASEHGVEEIAVALVRAGYDLPVAGHDLELWQVGDLKPEFEGVTAESAGADRPADRQKRIGDHRHGQFLGFCGH